MLLFLTLKLNFLCHIKQHERSEQNLQMFLCLVCQKVQINWSQNIWRTNTMTKWAKIWWADWESVQSQDEVVNMWEWSISRLWSPLFCLKCCWILQPKSSCLFKHELFLHAWLQFLLEMRLVLDLFSSCHSSITLHSLFLTGQNVGITHMAFMLHHFPHFTWLSSLHHHPSNVPNNPIYKSSLKAWPMNKVPHCQWCAVLPSFQINQAH